MSAAPLASAKSGRTPPVGFALASRYVLFACIAGAVNILVQAVTLQVLSLVATHWPAINPPYHLTLAMAAGTVAGLMPKYLLDSRWIFTQPASDTTTRRHARNIPLYTLTAVFTTFIFWAFEYLFDAVGQGNWHYVGAVIGLAVGYRVKFSLDRSFVFSAAHA